MADIATIEKRNGVAIVWLDQQGEKINKVSLDSVSQIDTLFQKLDTDPEVKAVVITSKKKDFIAGADIEMFQKVKKKGDFIDFTRNGHQSLYKLERSKKASSGGHQRRLPGCRYRNSTGLPCAYCKQPPINPFGAA